MRLYAIGDIHGQRAMLEAAQGRIARDREATGDTDAPVVHLGDLCDRGPDTRGVIDFLLDGIAAGAPWRVVRGNHDWVMSAVLAGPDDRDPDGTLARAWIGPNLGGAATLASYGVGDPAWRPVEAIRAEAQAAVPGSHRRFLEELEPYVETRDLILVHAGIRPGLPMNQQDEDDLLWIRDIFLDDRRDHGKLIVHGHTPVEAPEHAGNRIDLDTGAGYGRPLTAAVFEGRDCWILTEGGRVPLRPRR